MATAQVHEATNFDVERRARSRRFAYRVFRITLLLHLYLAWRLLPDLPIDRGYQIMGGIGLVVSSLLIPFGTLSRVFFENQKIIDRLTWAGGLTMGWVSSLLVFTFIRDLSMLLPRVRDWDQESAVVVLVLSIIVTMIGFYNARRLAKVVHITVPLDNLPSALEGFTVAQVTDIHIGPTIRRDYVNAIVKRVNQLNPDVIALTGDIVDGTVANLAKEAAPLTKLEARYGAFVVTGNHEYHHGADEWIAVFRDMGLKPLMNAHEVIEHQGANLVVAGINDYSANHSGHHHVSDPEKALLQSPKGAPKILLAHQPRSASAAEAAGSDLQLSGHTHGGQFWPWNYFVRLQQPYVSGLHRLGGMWIYISRGVGYWGPPKRFGAPSEITLITLSQATAVKPN